MSDESAIATQQRETAGNVMFGHHIVTLIDLLGQKSKLAEWDFLPETEYDLQTFIKAVQKSFGEVTQWRTELEKQLNAWLEARTPPAWIDTMPDKGQVYREFADTSIKFMHFSDTIVVYSPIVNQYGHANGGTVLSHLYTIGVLMLAALSQETVFRGAIEIGMAGQIDQAGIYGPVLSSVHHLESKVAEYPRIMVGPRTVEYLHALSADLEDSASARTNRGIAATVLSLIDKDSAGNPFLDYMGAGFTALANDKTSWQMIRERASQFASIESGLDKDTLYDPIRMGNLAARTKDRRSD